MGCQAMETGIGIKSVALIIVGAFSAALGFVLFSVFEEETSKVKK